jgi:anti-sigma B factor antagonist
MSQYYHYYDYNGTGVFEILNEKLNIFNTSEVVNQFRSIIDRGNGVAVIVDLKNVTHIDSVGIGFLIAIKNISSKKGCDIHLVCNNDIVLKVLKITKMDSFFNIFQSLDDAMQFIGSKG